MKVGRASCKRVRTAAFTVVEVIIACTLGLMVLAAAVTFMHLAGKSISGAITQSTLNAQAGTLIEFIQLRTRLATRINVDTNGNLLTLGFDDDTNVDSDSDGTPYNDQNHEEEFTARDGDGQINTTDDNSLVYQPRKGIAQQRTLIPAGLRKLPGRNFFTLTNASTVLISFGVVDSYTRDFYQGIDIQGTAVPLNRGLSSNFVSILP